MFEPRPGEELLRSDIHRYRQNNLGHIRGVGRIDWIGAILLVCYLVFVFTKSTFAGFYVQGAALFAVVLGITAGTMLGRVLGTRRGINKLLKTLEI